MIGREVRADRGRRARAGRGGTRTATAIALGIGIGALAGCSSQEGAGARQVASEFTDLRGHDARAACGLLAPGTRDAMTKDGDGDCATGLGAALGDPGKQAPPATEAVDLAGHQARVALVKDTVFLARFDDGWRVTAAGCVRVSNDDAVPYQCDVEAN